MLPVEPVLVSAVRPSVAVLFPVRRRDLRDDQAERHAIGRDVVQAQQQDELVLSKGEQVGPEQDTAIEIERVPLGFRQKFCNGGVLLGPSGRSVATG